MHKSVPKATPMLGLSAKYALLGVYNGVYTQGVETTLSHHLKAFEKKLYHIGWLKMEEFFDYDMPKLHIYNKNLRELSVPKEEGDLSFASFV